jgi:zinc protease
VALADPDSLSSEILMNFVYGLGINEIREYTAKISAVNLAQVNQTIQSLLHPDRVVVVTAGPGGETSSQK